VARGLGEMEEDQGEWTGGSALSPRRLRRRRVAVCPARARRPRRRRHAREEQVGWLGRRQVSGFGLFHFSAFLLINKQRGKLNY
jgi:hypothetical protein